MSEYDDQIDALCDRFEDDWLAGTQPSIAECVGQSDPAIRQALIVNLVPLDIEYRIKRGEAVSSGDYSELGEEAIQIAEDELQRNLARLAESKSDGDPDDGKQALAHDLSGSQIGPYRLVEKIGEGGMGSVWLAEQMYPVRRSVALKLSRSFPVPRNLSQSQRAEFQKRLDELANRFESERQTQAVMDHPNIAKVLDAGTTEDKRPYFVMELVDGSPINEYCDSVLATIRLRIDLMIQACKAIQHAHQKGIIHRDIKPSNVLVTTQDNKPVVKVIDFGLAKVTSEADNLLGAATPTQTGMIMGTYLYMSPEQAGTNTKDIDTRSDVYSLGVLFFELLTGSTPIDRARANELIDLQLLAAIREEESPRPSDRLSKLQDSGLSISNNRQTDVRKLSSILRGELDWIALKALAKDRKRRYDGPTQLAEDLQRYLDGEAIVARPPSVSYRLRKSLFRHRIVIGVGTAIIVTASVGFVTSLIQLNRAVVAEQIAKEETKNSQEASRVARQEQQKSLESLELLQVRNKESAFVLLESAEKDYEQNDFQGAVDLLQQATNLLPDNDFDKLSFKRVLKQWSTHEGHLCFEKLASERFWKAEFSSRTDRLAIVGSSTQEDGSSAYWIDVFDSASVQSEPKRISLLRSAARLKIVDEQAIVVALEDYGAVVAFDLENGKRLWKSPEGAIDFAVSPNGKLIAVLDQELLRLIDSKTGKSLSRYSSITPHKQGDIVSGRVAFSNDGTKLAISTGDEIKLFELNKQTKLKFTSSAPPPIADDLIVQIAFCLNDKSLVVGFSSGTARLYDTTTKTFGEAFGSFPFHSIEERLSLSHNGKHLALANSESGIDLWDLESGKNKNHFYPVNTTVSPRLSPHDTTTGSPKNGKDSTSKKIWNFAGAPMHFSRNDEFLTVCFRSGNEILYSNWKVSEGRQTWAHVIKNCFPIDLAYTKDDRLVSVSTDRFQIWNTNSTSPVMSIPTAYRPKGWLGENFFSVFTEGNMIVKQTIAPETRSSAEETIAFDPINTTTILPSLSGNQVAIATKDNLVQIRGWSPESLMTTVDAGGELRKMTISPSGQFLVTATQESMGFWNVSSGEKINEIPHALNIRELIWSPDEQRIMALCYGNSDERRPKESIYIAGLTESKIACPAGFEDFDSVHYIDNSTIALGFSGPNLKKTFFVSVIDLSEERVLFEPFEVHGSWSEYGWRTDGNLLFSTFRDRVDMYDLKTGSWKRAIGLRDNFGDQSAISKVVNVDLQIIVTEDRNQLVIWDLVTGSTLARLDFGSKNVLDVTSFELSPNGRHLWAHVYVPDPSEPSHRNGCVKVWDLLELIR